jgi:hypothetical protein
VQGRHTSAYVRGCEHEDICIRVCGHIYEYADTYIRADICIHTCCCWYADTCAVVCGHTHTPAVVAVVAGEDLRAGLWVVAEYLIYYLNYYYEYLI